MDDIRLIDVHKAFDGKTVISGVSYTFRSGSVTALTGPSGSGKTTLLNIILGLTRPDSGIVVGVSGLRMGVVFQEDRLIERLSARANVRLVCSKQVSDTEIDAHLRTVDLDEGDKRASEFSGGMRRRLALVRALIARPELLVLDEPFKGLDETSKSRAIQYIRARKGGATVIVVTHDQTEAQALGAEAELRIP